LRIRGTNQKKGSLNLVPTNKYARKERNQGGVFDLGKKRTTQVSLTKATKGRSLIMNVTKKKRQKLKVGSEQGERRRGWTFPIRGGKK